MIASMTAFRRALASPATHFRTLHAIIPQMVDGVPLVRRTSRFAEAIGTTAGGRQIVIYSPLSARAIADVERTTERVCAIRSPYLGEYRILCDELLFTDSLGESHTGDIIIEELPAGEPFGIGSSLSCHALGEGLVRLREHLQYIGFTHNNLRAENIIVGDDGRLHPIRLHYGRFGGAQDDFGPLFDLVASLEGAERSERGENKGKNCENRGENGERSDMVTRYDTVANEEQKQNMLASDAPSPAYRATATPATNVSAGEIFAPHEGFTRACRGGRYGFFAVEDRATYNRFGAADYGDEATDYGVGATDYGFGARAEGLRVAIPFVYLWADDFREGRAIVETEQGVGVIDKRGCEILPAVFDDVRYDVSAGCFEARLDEQRLLFGYAGEPIDNPAK